MPAYVQPKKLYVLAIDKLTRLLLKLCQHVEHTYGNYDKIQTRVIIQQCQQYLLSNIPGFIMDEICSWRCEVFSEVVDIRIVLSLFLNDSMKTFKIVTRSNESKLSDMFWISHLQNLKNLLVLHLNLACTDEILEIVGQCCPMLEEINIVSRVEPLIVPTSESFNALKLQYFVSDTGLGHLCQCKHLKTIIMNKILRSQFGGRMMTESGIRNLIKALPELKSISYDDVGSIISKYMEDVDKLSLLSLCDHHPTAHHVREIARLCPNLNHLCLQLSCLPNSDERLSNSKAIFEALIYSSISLYILELHKFHCVNPEFHDFLFIKGALLTNLSLISCILIEKSWLYVIGKACKNLKLLHIKESLDHAGYNTLPCDNCSEPLFKNLKCLCLLGGYWKIDTLLKLCVENSHDLEVLTVAGSLQDGSLDDVFTEIFNRNPLLDLHTISLFTKLFFSMSSVEKLIKNCPKLKNLTVMEGSNITPKEINSLKSEIHKRNLELNICLIKLDGSID